MNALSLRIKSIISSVNFLLHLMKNTNRQMKRVQNNGEFGHIDFENGIVHGKLQQIRHSFDLDKNPRDPVLTKAWCCDIPASYSKPLLLFIREFITPFDEISFTHIKRFDKINKELERTILRTVVCSQTFIDQSSTLEEYFKQNTNESELSANIKFYATELPAQNPTTKEIAQDWSSKYWPMSWKGNPYHQELKNSNLVLGKEQDTIEQLILAAKSAPKDFPVVTIFARERLGKESHEIIDVFYDNRQNSILLHSVMNGIEGIAYKEKHSRSTNPSLADAGYLCQDILVYTTHEPCIMCCMALVHSRISRITYLKPVKDTGGLESHYQLGDRPALNWRFKIWKWIGREELEQLENINQISLQHNFHA